VAENPDVGRNGLIKWQKCSSRRRPPQVQLEVVAENFHD